MSVKLLVIDDDSAVTDLLSLLLRSHGFEVGATNNSTEGLSMIRDNSPDVVILDLNLARFQSLFFRLSMIHL
jgi:DNA-binding response OmpR family regulator